MDLALTFDDVVRIAQAAKDPGSGWTFLVSYLENRGGKALPQLATVDLQQDIRELRRQIQELLASEPPPRELNAVYFGLFDAVDDDGVEVIGYYVAGLKEFNPENGDSLCNPAWLPEGRYLASTALDAVKEAEVSAGTTGHADLRALLGYAGQLGAALLVSRFGSADLFPDLHRVVGFDSGDFAEIAE
ncbi:MAG TPA: hypothetical protein VGV87_03590 [Blastocatellia bacterium]|nr:hypothetical protein [Blastocatellia bacterium]